MTISFSDKEKAVLVGRLQHYFEEHLSQEIGTFDAEFLVDFFSKEFGHYYYNRGLYDAQVILNSKIQWLTESIAELEQPTDIAK